MPEDEQKIDRLKQAMYSRTVSDKVSGIRTRREMNQEGPEVPHTWKKEETIQEVEGSMVAPKALHRTRKTLWLVLGAAAVFFMLSMAAFVYYVFFGFGEGGASARNIDITIQAPTTIRGGEITELQVTVRNRNDVPLELADLVFTFPPGTRAASDLKTDMPTFRQSLGQIEPGGTRQGVIPVVLIGSEGTRQQIQAELEYRLPDSNAVFVDEQLYDFVFAAAPVSIAIEANAEAISGQSMLVTATVASNADTVVRDVLLQAEYPFGFEFESGNPAPAYDRVWSLGDIQPGDKKTITIRGTMNGQQGDARTFRLTLGTRRTLTGTAIDVPLVHSEARLSIAQPFIGLSATVNGSSAETVAVQTGNQVRVNVNWQNNLPDAVTDVVIVAKLSGTSIPGATVRTTDGFYRSSDKTVLWDKTTSRGALAQLAPGARGTVSFSFDLPSESQLLSQREPTINIALSAAGKRVTEGVPETLQSSVTRRLQLQMAPKMDSFALYHGGLPFGGEGPLPPKVDQETTYAVVLQVSGGFNALTNGKVTAQLPPYVRWAGEWAPKGEHITFNARDGTVTWDIDDVAAGTGSGTVAPRQVAFSVAFTPSATQIGQSPALVRNIVFTATDAFTKSQLTASGPEVTTVLSKDPSYSGSQGEVVQ